MLKIPAKIAMFHSNLFSNKIHISMRL